MIFSRSGVTEMASMSTSNLPACRPAIMPSQSCVTRLHWILMRAQTFSISSGSKPPSLPPGSVRFHGSYAPSVAIVTDFQSFAWALAAPRAITPTATDAASRASNFVLPVIVEPLFHEGCWTKWRIANLYIQAWSEQKGLATFFSPKRENLGKILIGLVDKAYGGFTVDDAGNLTSGRSIFYRDF